MGTRGRNEVLAYWEERAEEAWAPVPDASLGRRSPGGGPKEGPGDAGETVSQLAWEHLGLPLEELEEASGVREAWASAGSATQARIMTRFCRGGDARKMISRSDSRRLQKTMDRITVIFFPCLFFFLDGIIPFRVTGRVLHTGQGRYLLITGPPFGSSGPCSLAHPPPCNFFLHWGLN